jgi:DNA-binding FadR family transcriptional regulator
MGLVDIHHGDGIYVKNYLESGNLELLKAMVYMSEKSAFRIIPQLLAIRGLLTPEMASRAAANRSEEELAEIRNIVEAGESISAIDADLAIHHIIARASGNVPYIFILNFFNQLFKDFGGIYFDSKENVNRSRKFHRDIYDAVSRRDERKARRVMADVLNYTEVRTAEAMNRSAGLPASQYSAVEAKGAHREA